MDQLIPRNNTSFLKEVHEIFQKIKEEKFVDHEGKMNLKYHQRIIFEYLLKYSEIRGILAYWEMGAGKTLLAVSLVEEISKKRKVLFISSKILHTNFINDYKKFLRGRFGGDEEEMEKYIRGKCSLITLTANNMLEQVYKAMSKNEIINESFEKLLLQSANEEDIPEIRKKIKELHELANLNNVFLIIDEAHNFFNGITNGSKNYIGLYEMIMEAKNIKLLFLSGSCIINDPFEICLCFNLLNGYFFTESDRGGKEKLTLFGEDYDEFKRYFVSSPEDLEPDKGKEADKKIVTIKNKEKFSNRIVGLVSFYGTEQTEMKHLFPTLEDIIIIRVPMSLKQYAAYITARDKEQEETKRSHFRSSKALLQIQGAESSSYRIRSRQISNFLYPEYASRFYKTERGQLKYEIYIDKLKPDVFNKDILEVYSPKMVELMENVAKHLPKQMLKEFRNKNENENKNKNKNENKNENKNIGMGPGIIYSQFLDSGVFLIAKALEKYGMKELKYNMENIQDESIISDKNKDNENKNENENNENGLFLGTFAIISGETPEEFRVEILKKLIDVKNKDGNLITLLLITSTGAEGITTKFMRHVHVFEPYWNYSRLSQIFSRAARLGSHILLPEDQRTIQPYIYLSDYPAEFESEEEKKIKDLEDTTDVTLYTRAVQNQIFINSYLNTLKESSIDCSTHYKNFLHCKMCEPTNEALFLKDLHKDINVASPCRELTEQKITAKSVTIEDTAGKREFMYTVDKKDIHIFQFQPNVNAYKEIYDNNPDYAEIYKKIQKKEGL